MENPPYAKADFPVLEPVSDGFTTRLKVFLRHTILNQLISVS